MADQDLLNCELCQRERELTFHHLIPRTLHKTKWYKKRYTREEMAAGVKICQDCHSAIHRFITEKQMGREFNSRNAIAKHPEVAKFVAWISKRNTSRIRTKKPNA